MRESPTPRTPEADAPALWLGVGARWTRTPLALAGEHAEAKAPAPGASGASGPHAPPVAGLIRAADRALATGRPEHLVLEGRGWIACGAVRGIPVRALVEGASEAAFAQAVRVAREAAGAQAESVSRKAPLLALAATSPSLEALLADAERLAASPLPVLVLGPSGAGKEWLARALHAASGRAGCFVAENCAALPESLVEAELFGAKRGAYTGLAADRAGLFQRAHGGTLLLDEVGDLPLALQAKLLRALQEGRVRRVGASREEPINLRVLAATHRDLLGLVERGRFRADLYYRLAGALLRLPALEERRADIPCLVATMLARAADEGLGPGRVLAPAALGLLARRAWPGGLRELDHALRRAMVLAEGPTIGPARLAGALRLGVGGRAMGTEEGGPKGAGTSQPGERSARDAERLLAALGRAGGVVALAARELGMSRQQLYRRLARLGVGDQVASLRRRASSRRT